MSDNVIDLGIGTSRLDLRAKAHAEQVRRNRALRMLKDELADAIRLVESCEYLYGQTGIEDETLELASLTGARKALEDVAGGLDEATFKDLA